MASITAAARSSSPATGSATTWRDKRLDHRADSRLAGDESGGVGPVQGVDHHRGILDLPQEPQRHVPLVAGGPAQAGLRPSGQVGDQVEHVVGRAHTDEQPHGSLEAKRIGRSEGHPRVGVCCWVAAQQLGLPAALTTVSHENVPIR